MEGKPEEINKQIELTKKYSGKTIPKLLKYLGKLNKVSEYEDWKKETNKVILNWIIDYLIIFAFVVFLCLTALNPFKSPPMFLRDFFLAEGISIACYIILTFKKALWRK